jgi:uncharacterized repeat protein (TIGR03987 family)
MLIYAITAISMALVFYTIGVWGEKIQGTLKKWHVLIFWIGLFFDTTGTALMGRIAGEGFKFNFHGITGVSAIFLMLFHAVWALYVMVRNDSEIKVRFHRLSVFVWIIWLIPYLSGIFVGMLR